MMTNTLADEEHFQPFVGCFIITKTYQHVLVQSRDSLESWLLAFMRGAQDGQVKPLAMKYESRSA